MSNRALYNESGHSVIYNEQTLERIAPFAPCVFYDDFIARALNATDIWALLDTAGGTETLKANAPNGVVELLLAVTSEAELAGLSFGDQRPFAIANKPIAEFRFRFTTLPTIATIAVIGLAGATNAVVDTIAESCWFRFDASGACTVESDDITNETSKVATGITLTANTWMIGRIDFSNPADVKFYINGNRVAAGTTFNMNAVTTLVLQPMIRIGKEAADAGLGVLELDFVRVWSLRA